MIDLPLETFARELASEVDEAVLSGQESPYHEQEFTRIVLDRLADDGALENPIALWQEGSFGRTVYKINGYSIPEDEERLVLITTVYTGESIPRALSRDEILRACSQAMKFYECSRKGLHRQIEPANTDASDLARRIFDAGERIGVLRVIVISDGLTGLKSIDLRDAYDGTRAIVDLFGIEQLHRILGEGLTRDDISIDLEADSQALPCLKATTESADYEAYLTVIPGAVLADIYEKYGTRLLELNVRAFLGLRGRKSVNANLRQTIREEPARFLAYNNGIVATADSMEIGVAPSGLLVIRSLRGFQIVNGGQTTASLHRALRQDKADLSDIQVPAKIIRVGESANLDNMVAAVSRSANSQNTVQPADFSANEPFHVAVESLANNIWLPDGSGRWFYERARGSYGAAEFASSAKAERSRRFARETPKERRFSKTDLAKYLNAWNGAPHLVSYGSQKNFQYFMQSMKEIHPDGFLPDENWYKAFIAKTILFRSVQKIAKAQKFPAYQANIAAYSVAWLAWAAEEAMDFDLIWKKQQISLELADMTADWVTKADVALRRSAGNRMPSEWAKKEDCCEDMRERAPRLLKRRPPELARAP
ncbi:AIPR family protein [Bradyrhizobium diazoefficiens]|uniref:AIPR family protein n=1 Tax=Bradyrhizobium diazoefficiens TaxID=1355477 RepID=UPI00190C754E|nr:AIPR family protein [Bradyrhizobium diazoefficiens]MBK3664786.1 AIPR family protein [Bradyrhizobium diazoefficiens]